MTTSTKFDLDVDPGPIDPTYTPSEKMLVTINNIANHDDIAFRFWAAMTLYVNMSTLFPCADAEDVVVFVVDDAVEEGEPTDSNYGLVVGENGQISGVSSAEFDADEPDEDERLVFEIMRQPEASARRAALIDLATRSAITHENISRGDSVPASPY